MGRLIEFWRFMKINKKFWLLPIVIILVSLGILLVFTKLTGMAPYIYTAF